MTLTRRTLRASLRWFVTGFALAFLALQGQSADPGPLPNTRDTGKKKPIRHRPLTIEEFRAVKPELTPSSIIRLQNGRWMPFARFLEEANRLERRLNTWGYTLRAAFDNKRSRRPVILSETVVGIDRSRAFQQQRPSMAPPAADATGPSLEGRLEQFEGVSSEWTVMDPSVFGARLIQESSALNQPAATRTAGRIVVSGYAFGAETNLVEVSAAANLPSGMQAGDPNRTASARHAPFVGSVSESSVADNGGTNRAEAAVTPPGVNIDRLLPGMPKRIMIGPIPVKLSVSVRVRTGGALTADSTLVDSHGNIGYGGTVSMTATALADCQLAGAGLATAIDVLRFQYTLANQTSLHQMPKPTDQNPMPSWQWTDVEWKHGESYNIVSGSGRVSLVVVIDLGFLGTLSFGTDLITWDGATWSQGWTEVAQFAHRPPGCGSYGRNSSCAAQAGERACVDLSSSLTDCGGCGVACDSRQSCTGGVCVSPDPPRPCHGCPNGWRCCERGLDADCCLLCAPPGAQCP